MSEAAAVSNDVRTTSWWDGIRPYFRTMPFVAFLLGISSGFPLTLLLATMTYWLSKVGIEKSTIGFAIGLTTPYTLNSCGRRWSMLAVAIAHRGSARRAGSSSSSRRCCSQPFGNWVLSNPGASLGCSHWAIIVAFLSATQDRDRRLSDRNPQRCGIAARNRDESVRLSHRQPYRWCGNDLLGQHRGRGPGLPPMG